MPAFEVDPAWCEIIYSYEIDDISSSNAITFIPEELLFEFYYMNDLSLSGLTSKSYSISVKGTAGRLIPTSVTASFTLTIKNPCIDIAYVTIEKAELANIEYNLYSYDELGFQFVHDPFRINTVPISHSLCGQLTYESTFMTIPIDNSINVLSEPSNNPISYDKTMR